MIRIDISKIEKWEEIKEKHKKYVKEAIEPKLKFLINSLKDEKELNEYVTQLEKIYDKLYDITCGDIFKIKNGKREEHIWFKEIKSIKIEPDENKRKKIEKILNDKVSELKNKIEKLEKKYDLEQPNYDDFLEEIKTINGIEFKKIENNVLNQKSQNKKLLDNRTEFIYNFFSKNVFSFKRIFNYGNFSNEDIENIYSWGRHSLLTMIGIEVCPYCQRNYISNYKEDKKNKTTADLDHFYSKDEYPYLALSLYNFVPSCQICNRTFKLAKPSENILYPYEECFDDYNVKFGLTEKVINNILDKETPFKVKINYEKNSDENKKRIKRTIDTFKLDKVYEESHNGYLKDMIENIEKYPKTYTKKLADIFLDKPEETEIEDYKIYQEKLQVLNDNFQEIIKKPYIDKIEKGEPLAKLTKDIMEELGIK